MSSIEYHTIRWSEIRLPHPERRGELIKWRVDGPFSLRSYYRVDGSREPIRLDLSRRRPDGSLTGCLACGHTSFVVRRDRYVTTEMPAMTRPMRSRAPPLLRERS